MRTGTARRIPVVLVLAAASGAAASCTTYEGSTPAQQVRDWIAATGMGSQLALLDSDARRVSAVEDAAERDVGALRTDCGVLASDTSKTYQLLPSPNAALSAGLDQALALEQRAAGDCYSGAAGGAQLARADAELARASVALSAVRAQLARLSTGTSRKGG